MTSDKTKLLNDKMNVLRQSYGSSLAGHLDVIKKLVEEISKTNNADDYQELRTVAHKLAGTGKTFNFPEITTAARTLENFIDQKDYNKEKLINLANNLTKQVEESINEIASEKAAVEQSCSTMRFPENSKILIADDDQIILLMLTKIFKPTGCEIVCAKDGSEAMEYLKSDIFSLVILDGMMPGFTGIELTKYIKTNYEHSKSPVILLTARDSKENIQEGLEAGADCYITKPFNPDDIIQKTLQLINSIK